jgi:hypothetical protein
MDVPEPSALALALASDRDRICAVVTSAGRTGIAYAA